MKRITITYHMGKPGETAENCITVPMSDEMAHMLRDYDLGIMTQDAHRAYMTVNMLIGHLAELAGYDKSCYLGSELAARQYEEVE